MDIKKFEEALRNNVLPKRPVKPNIEFSIKDFNSEEEYHTAMAETHYPKYRKDMEKYEEKRKEYNNKKDEVFESFKKELFKEYGPENASEKQLEKLYSKAYKEGHSSGLHSIMVKFEDISDFIEEYNSIS